MSNARRITRSLLHLATGLALASLLGANEEPTLAQRLEKLSERLEAARLEAHIPGMSIAIVKDDQLIWARGFGLADIESGRPADEETIYAIGSTTKAFTANLIGMLVDEGKLRWDDPVSDYLPYFDLQVRSEDEDAACTLRDLLCHRHGFSRMSILWFNNQLSREDILRTAATAEPWDDFRAGFHYCNVTYLAAGEAAGAADDSSWDDLMFERIFEPLEMSSSTLNVSEAREDERLSLGYRWDADTQELEHAPMVDLRSIGPAGSVNSNVLDMAKWLRLQLGRGAVDDMQLITSQRIRDTWSPQIAIGPGVDYGLGWMLRSYEGRKLVEHGGNIDGFSAQVGMLPEENLGYVLLMNLDAAPLAQASLQMVFDALLKEWPAAKPELADASASTEPSGSKYDDSAFDNYTGTYIANFGPFRDAEFTVRVDEDRLTLDIPGQQSSALNPPDEEGMWTSAVNSQVRVSFERNERDEVVVLIVHQGPYRFELPRKGVAFQPEVPAAQLEKYVGTYARVNGGKLVEITIDKGFLTMEDKGRRLPFHTPDAEGRASLRVRADQGATFKVDAEGRVDSFVFHGDAGDQLFERVSDKDSDLPSLEQVLSLRKIEERIAAMEAAGGTLSSGEVRFLQAGVSGSIKLHAKGSDCYASRLDFGKFGRIHTAVKRGEGWSYNTMRGYDELQGNKLEQALLQHPAVVYGDWSLYFDSVEVVRNDTLDGRAVHVLVLEKGELPSRTFWVDAENGDVLRTDHTLIEGAVRVPMTTHYRDFVEWMGIRRARRIELENPQSGKMVLRFEKLESGLELGDEVFTLVDPDAK